MREQVDETVKSERLIALQQLLDSQQGAFNASMVGKTLPVLLEKPGRHDDQLVGRSPFLQPVHLNIPVSRHAAMIGTVIDCEITGLSGHSLFAAPPGDADPLSENSASHRPNSGQERISA